MTEQTVCAARSVSASDVYFMSSLRERVRPWQMLFRPRLLPHPAAPENDPLSILNVLCNSDKHRVVTLTLAYSDDLTVRVHANDGKVHVWKGDGVALCALKCSSSLRIREDPAERPLVPFCGNFST